ncbi:MAG: acetyl-CoA carboxylase biotin carboxyl carrier protein [Lachnospiraceae bacterium]|nr:acetyl-CoA carboxylase biotin carboxyl carrier protein [Lachnospiraceae bacterium]
MEFEKLITLIQTVSESELTGFSYEEKGVSISMKKEKRKRLDPEYRSVEGIGAFSSLSQPEEGNLSKEAGQTEEKVIKSPLVGTFYSSPDPKSQPFVQPGDHVTKGQVLGIVEAMKLMNEIESDYEGVVKQILVSNEDLIEYGQPLFVIE